MILEHDYIRRMIERFGQALAKFLDPRKEDVTYDDFLYRLELTCYDCTGLDYQIAREMPAEELLKLLRPGEAIHPHRYLVIGDLLCLDAVALRQEGREEDAERRHEHALCLFAAGARLAHPGLETDFAGKLDALLAEQEGRALPRHVGRSLLEYFEAAGKYQRAERLLFDLTDTNDPEMLRLGAGFYERLALLPDEALHAEGLVRADVERGRRRMA